MNCPNKTYLADETMMQSKMKLVKTEWLQKRWQKTRMMFVWLKMKKDVASGMGTILFIFSGSSSSFKSDGSINSPVFPSLKIRYTKNILIQIPCYPKIKFLWQNSKYPQDHIIYLHHRLRSSDIHILCLRSLIQKHLSLLYLFQNALKSRSSIDKYERVYF